MTKKIRLREHDMEGVYNEYMRSISIAAFLRQLYNSIESAPTSELYDLAIKNLNSLKNFCDLTQLCASAGWLPANIATKYL